MANSSPAAKHDASAAGRESRGRLAAEIDGRRGRDRLLVLDAEVRLDLVTHDLGGQVGGERARISVLYDCIGGDVAVCAATVMRFSVPSSWAPRSRNEPSALSCG